MSIQTELPRQLHRRLKVWYHFVDKMQGIDWKEGSAIAKYFWGHPPIRFRSPHQMTSTHFYWLVRVSKMNKNSVGLLNNRDAEANLATTLHALHTDHYTELHHNRIRWSRTVLCSTVRCWLWAQKALHFQEQEKSINYQSLVIGHSQRFKVKLNVGASLVISVMRCIANWSGRVEVYDDEGWL